MFCPNCNAPLSDRRNRCERCGEDVTSYKKVVMSSNNLYNQALSKAKVRDLTGAIIVLNKSLDLNKKNTNARNLLGLIYYEIGDIVMALSEWIISKHFQSDDNDADYYINEVQKNSVKLDNLNQALKKYNQALNAAKQGNDDLAIIQLKKVVSINPKFVKAQQLLSLLYIHKGDKEKARRCLLKAKGVDITNTTTLLYLNEIGEGKSTKIIPEKIAPQKRERDRFKGNPDEVSFEPISSYKEDKPNIIAYINLVIGAIIGIAVVYILVVPTIRQNIKDEIKENNIQYSEELSVKTATITSLEKEKKTLEKKINKLQKQIDEFEIAEHDEEVYNTLLKAAKLFAEGNKESAAEKILSIDIKSLESNNRKDAINLYNIIKDSTFNDMSDKFYSEGYALYSSYKYEDAKTNLSESIKYNPDNVDALYFLGRAYNQLGDYENARKYYELLINDYSDTDRATKAEEKLAQLP